MKHPSVSNEAYPYHDYKPKQGTAGIQVDRGGKVIIPWGLPLGDWVEEEREGEEERGRGASANKNE